MSYHRAPRRQAPPARRGLGMPNFNPTTTYAAAAGPWSQGQFGPPGGVLSPYGWGPDFMVGMPMNYTHHIDYVRTPVSGIPGVRRRIGSYYDTLGSSGDGLGSTLVVL